MSHAAELKTTTGTARLAARVLAHSSWEIRGPQQPPFPARALLLFPREDARPLTPEDHGATLVVPDGTWSQSAKMIRRDARLRALNAVCLPAGDPSRFLLREQRHPNGLCTYEAIARALGLLEGSEVETSMLAVFEKMVERTLWSRGRLSAAQTRYGIPQAAWDFDREAGRRGGRARLTANVVAPQ